MITTAKTVKISSKGQITLPKPVRKMLQTDMVRVVTGRGWVKIEPVKDVAGTLSRYTKRYVPLKKIKGKAWEEALSERHLRN